MLAGRLGAHPGDASAVALGGKRKAALAAGLVLTLAATLVLPPAPRLGLLRRVRLPRPLALAAIGCALLLLAWALLAALDQSLWHDEAFSVLTYTSHGPGEILFGDYVPNDHVLFNLLAWLTTGVLGQSEVAYRLWSVLPALAAAGIDLVGVDAARGGRCRRGSPADRGVAASAPAHAAGARIRAGAPRRRADAGVRRPVLARRRADATCSASARRIDRRGDPAGVRAGVRGAGAASDDEAARARQVAAAVVGAVGGDPARALPPGCSATCSTPPDSSSAGSCHGTGHCPPPRRTCSGRASSCFRVGSPPPRPDASVAADSTIAGGIAPRARSCCGAAASACCAHCSWCRWCAPTRCSRSPACSWSRASCRFSSFTRWCWRAAAWSA